MTERTRFIARWRNLARLAAHAYLEERERLGFPIIEKGECIVQKLLLEIGVEELPASFIEPAVKQVARIDSN